MGKFVAGGFQYACSQEPNNCIDYEFLSCEAVGEADTCVKTKSMEKGTLILTVQYTETLDIGGVKEVKEECPTAP